MKEREALGRTAGAARANLAFRNRVTAPKHRQEWGLDQMSASYGAAFADFDRDGDLDLVVTNFGEPVSVYRNTGTAGHRVLIRLKGTRGNSWGIGATVRVETAAGQQARYLTVTSGFISANEPLAHFGLGTENSIGRLMVEWPSGLRQTFENLEADRFYTITEPNDAAPVREKSVPSPALFQRGTQFEGVRHRESDYDDFQREPLLPWKLSRLGPGLAVGDANNDGLEDLYLGGAAGQTGMLSIHQPNGVFRQVPQACFEADKASEDMGALFFDADGDGDQDLFVVSGGVECEPGDPVLRDRLHLNDGKALPEGPEGTLPDLRDSGSVVAPRTWIGTRFDLFVGGRCIPGSYPLTPNSRLLRNDRGKFVEVTDQVAPNLRQGGLVTAPFGPMPTAMVAGPLLTHEWGPVKFLNNGASRRSHAGGRFGGPIRMVERHAARHLTATPTSTCRHQFGLNNTAPASKPVLASR